MTKTAKILTVLIRLLPYLKVRDCKFKILFMQEISYRRGGGGDNGDRVRTSFWLIL
jgi:hypothetical protein